jgi:hypothetical protein
MAIEIEFVNLIIPIEKINQSSIDGGFEAYLKENEDLIGKTIWFDQHLFRTGWMSTRELDDEIAFWEKNGLMPFEIKHGVKCWKDMFVILSGIDQFTTDCRWIEFDSKQTIVWLKGTDPNEIYPNHEFDSYGLKKDIN